MPGLKMGIVQLVLKVILFANIVTGEEQACPKEMSVPLKQYTLQADRSIVLKDGTTYQPDTYWKSKNGTYYGCPCLKKFCLRRCPDVMLQLESSAKKDVSDSILEFTNFTVWDDNKPKQVNAHTHFNIYTMEPCDQKYALPLDPKVNPTDEYHILHNGSILFTHAEVEQEFAIVNDFCIYKDDSGTVQVITCGTEEQAPQKPFHHYMYSVFMLISVVFLLATLLAYVLAPEMRKVHGSSMACHSASMAVGFLGLATIQLVGQEISNEACKSIAFITYFFLLAAFFWLHVMCFDIWWAFSGFAKLTGSFGQQSKKKFIFYSLYAWTMPTILFTITLSIELSSNVSEHLKPGIGETSCWFQAKVPEFLYFNGPLSVILVMNLYFFISTAVKLFRLKKETAILKRGDSRMHNTNEESDDKERYNNKELASNWLIGFKLYLKLFLVMGLSWITETLSHAIGGPKEIWYLTDSINTLQGVLIFVLCVWTTKVRDSVVQRLCPKYAPKFSPHPSKSVTKSCDISESATAPIAMPMVQLQNSADQAV